MKIIKNSQIKTNVEYCLEYDCTLKPGSGWSFDCDKNGKVFKPNENLEKIKNGEIEAVYKGIKKYSWNYFECAVGKCECGHVIDLYDPLDNFCTCGLCYNSSGQLVTPSGDCDEAGHPYDYDY